MSGSGAHAVDLARWLLADEITTVTTAMSERPAEDDQGPTRVVQTTSVTTGGTVVTLVAGRAHRPANGFAVLGTRGRLTVVGSVGNDGGGVLTLETADAHEVVTVAAHDVYAMQFDAFVLATDAGAPPSASGLDGLTSLAVVAAVERSLAEHGAPCAVELPTFEGVQ